MPGVRYGPDIADDAAYVMNNLVELNRKFRETGKRPKNYNKFERLAHKIFGVKPSDIKKGKYGDLAKLATYSTAGRDSRGRAYKRGKLAKSWRTGKIMKRGLRQEFIKRGETPSGRAARGVRKAGRGKKGDIISGIPGIETQGRGGATYLGRTKTKQFDRLANAAYARAKKNKITKTANAAGIDTLNIARVGKFLPGPGWGGTSSRPGATIRPPKSKTAAAGARAKTKAAVKGAGKRGNNSTAKAPGKPKAVSKPAKPKTSGRQRKR